MQGERGLEAGGGLVQDLPNLTFPTDRGDVAPRGPTEVVVTDGREKDLAEIPELRIPDTTSRDEQIDAIVKNLRQRGHSRPRKVRTLQNTINTLFTKKLEQEDE